MIVVYGNFDEICMNVYDMKLKMMNKRKREDGEKWKKLGVDLPY